MKIEKINQNIFMIIMERNDLDQLNIDFNDLDYSKPQTRKLIWSVIEKAGKKSGYEILSKRLLIEALPIHDDGCALCVTMLPQDETKQKPVKTRPVPYIFNFSETEDMLSALKLLPAMMKPIPDNRLYKYGDNYRFAIYSPQKLPAKITSMLSEYGDCLGQSDALMAATCEYGTVIAEKNAAQTIRKHFYSPKH